MRLSIARATLAISPLAMATGCQRESRTAAAEPVKWTLSDISGRPAADSSKRLVPGATLTVHIAAALDTDWYIYSLTQKAGGPTPMTVTVAPSPPFKLAGEVSGPAPIIVFDKEFNIDTERYQGAPKFAVPVTTVSPARGDSQTGSNLTAMDLKVRYQACNATYCLPARTVTLKTPVRS